MDNTDAGYMEKGSWKTVRRIGYRKNERVGESTAATTAHAEWTFTVVPRGSYDIYATWQVADSAKSEPDMEATFTIENGERRLASISVNQEEDATGSRYKNVWWQKLGTWDFRSPQVTVRLSPSAHSRSIFADAVLLRRHKEQPTPVIPSVQVPTPLVSTGSRMSPPALRPSTGVSTSPSPATTGAASGNAPTVPSTPSLSPSPPTNPSIGPTSSSTGTGSLGTTSSSSMSKTTSSSSAVFSSLGPPDMTLEVVRVFPSLPDEGLIKRYAAIIRSSGGIGSPWRFQRANGSLLFERQGSGCLSSPKVTFSFAMYPSDFPIVAQVQNCVGQSVSLQASPSPVPTVERVEKMNGVSDITRNDGTNLNSYTMSITGNFMSTVVLASDGSIIKDLLSGGCEVLPLSYYTRLFFVARPDSFPLTVILTDCTGKPFAIPVNMPSLPASSSSSAVPASSPSPSSSSLPPSSSPSSGSGSTSSS